MLAYIAGATTDITVELRDLRAILDDVVLNDEVDFTLPEADGHWTLTIDRFRSDRLMQKLNDYNAKRGVATPGGQLPLGDTNPTETEEDETDETPAARNAKKAVKFKPISDEGLKLIEYLSLDCTHADGPWYIDLDWKIDKKGFVLLNGTKTGQFWDGTLQSPTRPLRLKVRNVAGDESVVDV